MILLHRFTSFAVGLIIAIGFLLSILWPANIFFYAIGALLAALLLLGRLSGFEGRNFRFWALLGTPILFAAASFGVFLFFENLAEKIILAAVVVFGVFLFTEYIFAYLHTPAAYRTYSLEHLSLVLQILTVFFVASFAYGLILFLQISSLVLLPFFFALIFFLTYSMFWVSKISHQRSIWYALAGSVMISELFVATSYLPIGFYTSAALIAISIYVFLGLSRIHVLEKLTNPIVFRYLALGSIMLILLLSSAQWV
ncbi:MAG: hypothetical protein ABIH67_05040 [Candidatus Uhrbacteria bacterium]